MRDCRGARASLEPRSNNSLRPPHISGRSSRALFVGRCGGAADEVPHPSPEFPNANALEECAGTTSVASLGEQTHPDDGNKVSYLRNKETGTWQALNYYLASNNLNPQTECGNFYLDYFGAHDATWTTHDAMFVEFGDAADYGFPASVPGRCYFRSSPCTPPSTADSMGGEFPNSGTESIQVVDNMMGMPQRKKWSSMM